MYSSRKLYTLHSNRNIYSVLCSIPITPPPISIWVELDKKAKSCQVSSTSIAPSNQKETTISATQHKMMHPPECRVTDRSIPIPLLHPMISVYLNTGKSGIWQSSLDLPLQSAECFLLMGNLQKAEIHSASDVRSERHRIVCSP